MDLLFFLLPFLDEKKGHLAFGVGGEGHGMESIQSAAGPGGRERRGSASNDIQWFSPALFSPLLFFPWPGSEVVTPIFGFLVLSHLSRVLERADYLWCPYFYDFPVRFHLSERKPQRRAGGSGKAAEVYITQAIVTQSSLGRFTMSFVCYVQRPVDFLRYFISWVRCIFLLLLACCCCFLLRDSPDDDEGEWGEEARGARLREARCHDLETYIFLGTGHIYRHTFISSFLEYHTIRYGDGYCGGNSNQEKLRSSDIARRDWWMKMNGRPDGTGRLY